MTIKKRKETKMEKKTKYTFGEKTTEYDKKTNKEIAVWQSPKYKESKDKAIEMIESKKYGLTEADFWILMNRTNSGKMAYTGLIISHNGCLKINDIADNKVKPECFTLDKEGYAGSLVYTYIDEDTYEVGEFSSANGQNAYPYAMAFKRCFDRVVLKKSKLAYSGIYSEVEADDFKRGIEEETEAKPEIDYNAELKKYIAEHNMDIKEIAKEFKLNAKSKNDDFKKALEEIKKGEE